MKGIIDKSLFPYIEVPAYKEYPTGTVPANKESLRRGKISWVMLGQMDNGQGQGG